MLCESRLWSMSYDGLEERRPQSSNRTGIQKASGSAEQTGSKDSPQLRGVTKSRPSVTGDRRESHISPLLTADLHQCPDRAQPATETSPKMEIPCHAPSGGDVPFLVPSFCQSICENYSDLHIGGDQVLPISGTDGEVLLLCHDSQGVAGPFLQSCDVPSAADESLLGQTSQGAPLSTLRGVSTRLRLGSGARDRSMLFQGCEGPFSNSLLNRYLEHKLLDLYQQYMLEHIARDGIHSSGPTCPLLASELVLTSLDQITLQLSREGNMQAGLAKDMVLSCLLRVASNMQSTEISTPLLQISSEAPATPATGVGGQESKGQALLNSREFPVKEIL